MDFIPALEHAKIESGVSEFDCTDSIQHAILQAQKISGTLYIKGGTYFVSSLKISGSNYSIETDKNTVFKQIRHGASKSPYPVFEILDCSDVSVGMLNVVGNILHDIGEHNHAVFVGRSKRINIGHIYAKNIRGDAIYCYGRDTSFAERLDGLYIASVSGHNVFRNLVSIVGGRVSIGEIINAGPVGYRDLDVEPNAEGGYQAPEVLIGKAVIGSLEVTSDDPKTRSLSVKIGEFDADGRRIQPTTPPYPGAPGRNGYALGVAHVELLEIAHAKLRNYASYAIGLGPNHGEIRFRELDIANCDFDERTFNSAIAKRGSTAGGQLIIEHLRCVHPDNSKWLIHSDQPNMPVTIGGGEISGGLLAVNCIVDAQLLTIDAGGAQGPAGAILIGARGSKLRSVSIKGARKAILLFDSPDCSLVGVSGEVAAITNDGRANVRLINSAIRSVR